MLRGLHTVMQPVGKLRPKCVSSMNAETSDTPVQITYPTNVGQSTFHKLHLHQFQQTKRSQEIHFWCLKITRRFNTIVKQLSLSHPNLLSLPNDTRKHELKKSDSPSVRLEAPCSCV